MAVKLTVGLTKKIGLPDYGSLGASCSVEIEIDKSVFESVGFQQQVSRAFDQCRTAVEEQLSCKRATRQIIDAESTEHVMPQTAALTAAKQEQPSDSVSKPKTAPATQSQLRAIFAIARRLSLNPQDLVAEHFNLHAADQLSIRQASQLIDQLKRMPQEMPS